MSAHVSQDSGELVFPVLPDVPIKFEIKSLCAAGSKIGSSLSLIGQQSLEYSPQALPTGQIKQHDGIGSREPHLTRSGRKSAIDDPRLLRCNLSVSRLERALVRMRTPPALPIQHIEVI